MAEKKDTPLESKKKLRIAIVGAGGIGAYLAQFLYDLGVNRKQFPFLDWEWTVFDDDTVDVSNLLHQNFTDDDLGNHKAQIVSDRAFGAYRVELRFATVDDLKNFDVVFSCVDGMAFRKELYAYGDEHPELRWFDGRCNSRNIAVLNNLVPKKDRDSMINDSNERAGCLHAADKKKKISHITPVIVAGMLAQTFLNYLRGEDTRDRLLMIV